jgi:hypothetical protein
MTDENTVPIQAYQPPPAGEGPDHLADGMVADAVKPLAQVAKGIEQLPPGVKLSSNLDTYERERPTEPFWFQHEGEFFRLVDPEDVDLQDILIGQENPRLMLHVLLDDGHRDRFFAKRLPIGKMKQLVHDYTKHFGLTDLGELAGSARSSIGTQGR